MRSYAWVHPFRNLCVILRSLLSKGRQKSEFPVEKQFIVCMLNLAFSTSVIKMGQIYRHERPLGKEFGSQMGTV